MGLLDHQTPSLRRYAALTRTPSSRKEPGVPESRRRKKKDARPAARAVAVAPGRRQTAPSPPWFGATLAGLFVVGIAWLLTFYFSNGDVVHFRPSGNADEFRIYAVADSQHRADEIVAMGVAEPDGLLRQL